MAWWGSSTSALTFEKLAAVCLSRGNLEGNNVALWENANVSSNSSRW